MARTITWLHLSDLHAGRPGGAWDARRVLESLQADLRRMQSECGLRPDFIFFTGDAAFGHIGDKRGETLIEQLREAHDFLTGVRETFRPAVPQRNLYLVPGNHDVNRTKIYVFEKEWLANLDSLEALEEIVRKADGSWKHLMLRLDDYAQFLAAHGYEHLLGGREHMIFTDHRSIAGLRVGIAGFNSAWSSCGDGPSEMGRLWAAGRFQQETLLGRLMDVDLRIALIHHPGNWFRPQENPSFFRGLQRDFEFVLHGHEHEDFVSAEGSSGHTTLSAGACHEWSQRPNNGYNFVRIDVETMQGEAWLRRYDSAGGGWIPRVVHGRTDDHGCWPLSHLERWMEKLDRSGRPPKSRSSRRKADGQPSEGGSRHQLHVADYEKRYREYTIDQLDYMQLFGVDTREEAEEYSLSVAYVSITLTDELAEESLRERLAKESRDEDPEVEDEASESFPEQAAETKRDEDSESSIEISAENLFDMLGGKTKRLLIRGPAGCGKTTLLRWAAVQAAKYTPSGPDDTDWRGRIPFLFRLRDCENGELPRLQDYPELLAKFLSSDPPPGWVQDVFSEGRALVMFDGVDEVLERRRMKVFEQVRQMVKQYPDNAYVVTTRPEAFERNKFRTLNFLSARVRPLPVKSRNALIDRWHEAIERQLRSRNHPTDLRPAARRLKAVIEDDPAVARLTMSPLLCVAICALYHRRKEALPETTVSLCEKVCEMLISRRERERGTDLYREDLKHLDYDKQKGLLSRLAYQMVLKGDSAINDRDAKKEISDGLESHGVARGKGDKIFKALVERSGMLQESSEDNVEFLHNTLKEYLAAERIVNSGDVNLLARHCHDPAWQPVLLFAVALPREGSRFATDLLRKVMRQTPSAMEAKRSSGNKEEAARVRAKQFFFCQCVAGAHQITDKNIEATKKEILQELIPPNTMEDAESLAICGEPVAKYLASQPNWTVSQRAASLRALGLIGGQTAKRCLASYDGEQHKHVLAEMVGGATRVMLSPESKQRIEVLELAYRREIEPSFLSGFTNLRVLDLSNTDADDLEPLRESSKLEVLGLANTKVQDPKVLTDFEQLRKLDLSSTGVGDIWALRGLEELRELRLSKLPLDDIRPLADLERLEVLDLGHSGVVDISALSGLMNLRELNLAHTRVQRISVLSELPRLESINLSNTRVDDVSCIGRCSDLHKLMVSNCPVSDVTALASLGKLQELNLSKTKVSDASSIGSMVSLRTLVLVGTRIRDISSFDGLINLQTLNLSHTDVEDVMPLTRLPNLRSLVLRKTNVSREHAELAQQSMPQCKIRLFDH